MNNKSNIIGIFPKENASACLLQDGKIVAVGEEERFNRIKTGGGGLPFNSIKYVLEEGNISLDDVDCIAVAWNCKKYPDYIEKYRDEHLPNRSSIDFLIEKGKTSTWNPEYIEFKLKTGLKMMGVSGELPEVKYVPHHLCHAASTFYLSEFKESLILTLDGSGEENTTVIWKGVGDKITKVKEINVPNSLGWFYSAITEFLGFRSNSGEGKVMGLAPYGNEVPIMRELFEKILKIKDNFYEVDTSYIYFDERSYSSKFTDKLVNLLGTPRKKGEKFTQFHKDVAFMAQSFLEDAVVNLVLFGIKETGLNNVCVAGGVGMNCKMNGKILEMDEVNDIFVVPPSSDNGTSIGSALQVYKSMGLNPRKQKLENVYYGPSFSNEEIKRILDYCKVKYTYCDNIEEVIAEKIYDNKIIGWFQGRMEIGSRALGNRSILANPLNKDMKDIINSNVKHREAFRPFCPSMLKEDAGKYLKDIDDAPYMIVAYQANEGVDKLLPSVVHVDNSVRPQTVTKKQNLRYWNLINEFKKLSGESVILNTSFNIAGEPIVCTPQQAIRCFFGTGIDILALGNYLIEKS